MSETPTGITVLTKDNCKQCWATEKNLEKRGAQFRVENIMDPQHREAVAELGYLQAPVVIVNYGTGNDVHWSGYRPDLIEEHTRNLADREPKS